MHGGWSGSPTSLAIVVAVAWFQLFRPQFPGGPAGYAVVQGTSMEGAFADGDLVVTRRHPEYAIGQVVAFRAPDGIAVIHRIVG